MFPDILKLPFAIERPCAAIMFPHSEPYCSIVFVPCCVYACLHQCLANPKTMPFLRNIEPYEFDGFLVTDACQRLARMKKSIAYGAFVDLSDQNPGERISQFRG